MATTIQRQIANPKQLEDESAAWWAEFIEHHAARGVERKALNEAVAKFRLAQAKLTLAIREYQTVT